MKNQSSTSSSYKRIYTCPQCGKHRMSRPEGHSTNMETKKYTLPGGESIELLSDICDFCLIKNYKKYFLTKKEDTKKVLRAIENQEPIDGSLEDIL